MSGEASAVNVLLVDDKPHNLLALQAALGGMDLNLVTAGSGEAALSKVLRDDFAVILLDVYMPGMDGLETATLLRQRERSHDTPIIFVTAAGRGEDIVAQGYVVGAVDYIVKPVQPAILRSKVAVFAELFRRRAQVALQAEELAALNAKLEARVRARTVRLERAVKDLEGEIAERQRAEQEAREALRLRDDFLSIASHELKTPLTALMAAVQFLLRASERESLDRMAPERVQRMLEIVDKQTRRLSGLVGDLLDVSRIRDGRLPLELEEVDLAAVAREVVERCGEEIARAGCALELCCQERVVGLWDRFRLEQVVENLLSNALKYGAGSAVRVAVEGDAAQACLVVMDHGIGIAPEHLESIFGRFERAVSSSGYGGVGLGLYIVREIVEALGGTVGVASEYGHGATFTVRLPREPAPAPAPDP